MTFLIPTIKPPFELILKIFRVSHIANILKSTWEMFPVFSQQCAMPVIQNKNTHKLVAGLQTTSQYQSSNPPSFHLQGRRPKTYLEGFHEPWIANTYTDKAPLLRTLTKQISSQVASFFFCQKRKKIEKSFRGTDSGKLLIYAQTNSSDIMRRQQAPGQVINASIVSNFTLGLMVSFCLSAHWHNHNKLCSHQLRLFIRLNVFAL